jgi:hypothetical protein
MRHIKNIAKSKGPLFFIVLGFISVIWFLLRVIPKPSRITYPCQRMAAANAVAFITWLLGQSGMKLFLRISRNNLISKQKGYTLVRPHLVNTS